MNITAKSSKLFFLKLILLVTFSLFYHSAVNAEESLYERGKELVALKEYEKALKAFEGKKAEEIMLQKASSYLDLPSLLELAIPVSSSVDKDILKIHADKIY